MRVSGPTQAGEDKYGLARQRDKIQKWAAANHVKIAGEFIDTMTGTSEWGVRPGWQKMLTAMLADGVTLIVIDELGRLARDIMVQEKIVADLQERKFDLPVSQNLTCAPMIQAENSFGASWACSLSTKKTC